MLKFGADEIAPIRRGRDGLIAPERHPSPVRGRRLALSDALFAAGAVVMDAPASSWVRYSAPGAPGVTVSWDSGFPNLGIWSRPDAGLLCIEPWHGMASPVGFDGAFADKPGVMLIPPGERRLRRFRGWTVRRCATGCTATTPKGYLGFVRSDPAGTRRL